MLVGASCFDCGWGGIQIQTFNHIKYSKYDYVLFADSPGSMWGEFAALPNVKHIIFTGDSDIKKFAAYMHIDAFIHHTVNHIARDSIKDLYALGIPVVVFHHCSFKPIYDARFADEIITTSDSNIAIIKENPTFENRKIHKLHLSLDFTNYDPFVGKKQPDKSKVVIGRFGRLEPVKLPDKFIEAAYHIYKIFPAEFIVGGALSIFQTQNYLNKLLQQVEDLKLQDRFTFTGSTTELEKIRILSEFDIFLYPTSFEGYCMAFIEAMYLKKPVVTFDNLANKETVGPGGIVVPYDDMKALVKAVDKIIRSPKLARELGEAGHALVKERNNVKNFAAYIDGMLGKYERTIAAKPVKKVDNVEPMPIRRNTEKFNICIGGWGLVDEMISTPEYLHLKHLSRKGHNVDFFCVTPTGCNEVEGVTVNRGSVFDPGKLKYTPDVMHIHHTENPLSMHMAQWAKAKGIPVVMNIHSISNPVAPYIGIVNKFVVFSEAEYKLRVDAVGYKNICIVPNGVDSCDYTSMVLNKFGNGIHVLFVGQFFDWKGIYTFVDVAKAVNMRDSSFKFHMVTHVLGDIEKLKHYIGNFNIKLYPAKHGERKFGELVDFYRSCDIFFLPTKMDCFPTTIIEAMMCSKPVVATTVGGICNQIDNEVTGFHVSHLPKNTTKEAIARILELKDPDLREKMGAAGRAKAMNKFNIDITIDSYVDLYYDLINERCTV